MNELDFVWQNALLIANAMLIGAAALAVVQIRREFRQSRAFWTSPAAVAMQPAAYDDRELRRMVDRRITMLEKYIERYYSHPMPPATTVPGTDDVAVTIQRQNELPMEYAVRMVKSGAAMDDLVRGCGLNLGEAQLLMRLHAATPHADSATQH